MSARDVITKWMNKSLASPMGLTTEEHAACILSALDAAGYAVVPKGLLAKVQNDPPLTGRAQFDLTAKGIET